MMLRMVNKYGMIGTIAGMKCLDNTLQVTTSKLESDWRAVDLYNSLVGETFGLLL